jgi:hypothetical protein
MTATVALTAVDGRGHFWPTMVLATTAQRHVWAIGVVHLVMTDAKRALTALTVTTVPLRMTAMLKATQIPTCVHMVAT